VEKNKSTQKLKTQYPMLQTKENGETSNESTQTTTDNTTQHTHKTRHRLIITRREGEQRRKVVV